MGGCALKKHKAAVNTEPPIPLSFVPNLLVPAPPAPPSFVASALQPSPTSAPLPLPTPVQFNEVVDARPDPRYASHLRPIFTQQIAEQQEKSRQQSLLEAEWKENTQKAKQRVTVYSWMADNTPPSVKITQDFIWPHLSFSSTFLTSIGLSEAGATGELFMYDEGGVFDWVSVDVGHVVEVQEGQRIFLKDCSARKCMDFDKILGASQYATPHLHRHLARERAYVRDIHKSQSPLSTPHRSQSQATPTFLSPIPIFTTAHTPGPYYEPLFPSTPSPLPQPPLALPTGSDPFEDPINSEAGPSTKRWPTDFYTIDIAACLREANGRTHTSRTRRRTQQQVFTKHFPGVRFTPSTFTDQKNLWARAPNDLREEFLEFGQCPDGLWSAFARRVRRGY